YGADREARVDLDQLESLEMNDRRIAVTPREDIAEPLAQAARGFGRGEAGQRRVAREAHRPQVVDAVTMVGVVVRPEHRVDLVDAIVEELLTQVGRGIDKQPLARVAFDDNRDPCAPVLRLVGIALSPVVAEPRHAGRSAAPEHEELHAAALSNSW